MIEVICQGSPYEMGRLQGMALRAKIHAAHAALGDLERCQPSMERLSSELEKLRSEASSI